MAPVFLLPRLPAVWLIALPPSLSSDLLDSCKALLNRDERTRAAAFRVEPAREQYVVAHAVLRTLLTRIATADGIAAVRPADWHFANGPYGKPHVAGPLAQGSSIKPPFFNLSHTEGLVAIAICDSGEIGVDVESTSRPIDPALFTACLSAAEQQELAALAADAQRLRFFDIWTAKEAYAKALGTGLSTALKSITISDAAAPTPTLHGIHHFTDRRWHLRRLDVSPSHAAVVVLDDDGREPAVHRHTIAEWAAAFA